MLRARAVLATAAAGSAVAASAVVVYRHQQCHQHHRSCRHSGRFVDVPKHSPVEATASVAHCVRRSAALVLSIKHQTALAAESVSYGYSKEKTSLSPSPYVSSLSSSSTERAAVESLLLLNNNSTGSTNDSQDVASAAVVDDELALSEEVGSEWREQGGQQSHAAAVAASDIDLSDVDLRDSEAVREAEALPRERRRRDSHVSPAPSFELDQAEEDSMDGSAALAEPLGERDALPKDVAGTLPLDPLQRQTALSFWWDVISPDLPWIVLSAACAGGYAFIYASLPRVFGDFIDSVGSQVVDQHASVDWHAVARSVGRVFLQLALKFGQVATLGWAVEGIGSRLNQTLLRSLLHQEMGYFDGHSVSAEVNSTLADDVTTLTSKIRAMVPMAVTSSVALVSGITQLFELSAKLTAVLLAGMPPAVLIGNLYARSLRSRKRDLADKRSFAAQGAAEALDHIRTVRAHNAEDKEIQRYQERLASASSASNRMSTLVAGFFALSDFFLQCASLAVLLYGGHLVQTGELTAGQLTTYIVHTMRFASSTRNLSVLGQDSGQLQLCAHRIRKSACRQATDGVPQGPVIHGPRSIRGAIQFEHVRFAYPTRPEKAVLHDFSIRVQPGQVVALVGASGSGKSTVVQLLARFYDVLAGSISVDGVDVADLDPRWVRHNIAMVQQEPVLFSLSVRENILYGLADDDRRNSDQVMREAARDANALDFIESLPDGFDTVVRSDTLSGGQKQRLAIARAFATDAPIVVLDEATSALDTASEKAVYNAIQKLTHGRTVLVIAHRLSTIRQADQIVVLRHGRIVEVGSHRELSRANGYYAELCALGQTTGDLQ